jgi:hypothetical protein
VSDTDSLNTARTPALSKVLEPVCAQVLSMHAGTLAITLSIHE